MTTLARPDDALAGAARLRIDPRRQLVVVAPHPDDEVIGFGGVIFDHVAAGGRVVVVSITDGDAFDPGATIAGRRDAGARRRAEQLEALGVLGVDARAILRLRVPDGEVASNLAKVICVLRGLLDALASDGEPLVVTPWRADGHPDHEATTRAVRRCGACEILEVPIWSWHHRHERVPAWQGLSVAPISAAAREAKRAALRRHRTQLAGLPGGRPPILSPRFLADFDREAEVVVR